MNDLNAMYGLRSSVDLSLENIHAQESREADIAAANAREMAKERGELPPRLLFFPRLPKDVVESTPIILDKNDPPRCLVIRYLEGGVHPYVVHVAVLQHAQSPTCQWEFHNGNYCRELEEAQKAFEERKQRIF